MKEQTLTESYSGFLFNVIVDLVWDLESNSIRPNATLHSRIFYDDKKKRAISGNCKEEILLYPNCSHSNESKDLFHMYHRENPKKFVQLICNAKVMAQMSTPFSLP